MIAEPGKLLDHSSVFGDYSILVVLSAACEI